ncbi:unnamed protein product [Heligmosomoides polygyrus]|uniref:SCP domain-containing protein n=1 Tax=Heligmosomoides polygyrus TaxID=6339 RepID=A0A183FW46_HELPZ|nr:unnamed protein product [Heligmosomoides polygyrus]
MNSLSLSVRFRSQLAKGEVAKFNGNKLPSAANMVELGFKYQMAWATTTKFGCGVAKCSGGFFVVCHYQPGGNVVGATVYSKGTTCSQCPTGTYCSSPLCVLV